MNTLEATVDSQQIDYCDNFNFLSLTKEAIVKYDEIIDKVRSNKSGAVSVFIGTTRDSFEGKEVIQLEYECYPDMCLNEFKNICNRSRENWNLNRIAIHHKIGPCPIGEISVIIAVSSEHRIDSLNAVQFIIDELKKTVPIWKKEFYGDGNTTWKENRDYKPILSKSINS